jgi:aspartyl-tRNA(Asn)/glutamyl-tRNA(Gln) amidotransferase subunit B
MATKIRARIRALVSTLTRRTAGERLQQVTDTGAIEKLVKDAIAANPVAIEAYKGGKASALGAVVGWIMKQSKGQASPAMVNELLKKHIG